MRPLIFLKAKSSGRSHLTPVQKQVVRNGKVFMQTFYVARKDLASGKEREEKQEWVLPDLPSNPKKVSNRPEGGFWINSWDINQNDDAVRVPEEAIHSTFKYEDFSFVIHKRLLRDERKWAVEYTVTELGTGRSVGAGTWYEDPEESKQVATDLMNNVGIERVKKAILSDHPQIAEIENTLDGTDFPIDRLALDNDYKAAAKELIEANVVDIGDNKMLMEGDVIDFLKRDPDNTIEKLYSEVEKMIGLYAGAHDTQLAFEIMHESKYDMDEAMQVLLNVEELSRLVHNDRYTPRVVWNWAGAVGFDMLDYSDIEEDLSFAEDNMVFNRMQVFKAALEHMEHPQVEKEHMQAKAEENRFDNEEAFEGAAGDNNYMFLPEAERQSLLEKNDEKARTHLGGGINETSRVILANGQDIQAVWKPMHGEDSARQGIEVGTYYIREALAWEVNKLIGFDTLVPPTVIKELADDIGSVQEFQVDAYSYAEKHLSSTREVNQMASLMDFILFNTDRHNGNLMVSESGDPILIDNGLCMPTNDTRLGNAMYHSPFYGDAKGEDIYPGVMEKLKTADWNGMLSWMQDNGIEEAAQDLFVKRVGFVIKNKKIPDTEDIDYNNWADYSDRIDSVNDMISEMAQ